MRRKPSKFADMLNNFINHKHFRAIVITFTVVLVLTVLTVTAPWGVFLAGEESLSVDPTSTPTASPTPTSTPTESPTATPENNGGEDDPMPTAYPVDTRPTNPLTGIHQDEDNSHLRPFAVVMNNEPIALPMLGIKHADIIFEHPRESSTRMLAIYQDLTGVGVIGSVRSVRVESLDVANSFDAIMIHEGSNAVALAEMNRRGTTRIYEGRLGFNPNPFDRDAHRHQTMQWDASLVLKSRVLLDVLANRDDIRMLLPEGYRRNLSFIDDATPINGHPALEVEVSFMTGLSKISKFTYDESSNLYYLRQQFWQRIIDFIDSIDGNKVGFTNVLVLQTTIKNGGHGGGVHDVTTTGEGDGFFINGGKYIEITWSRETESSQFVYTLKDGSELKLGRGTTFICIVASNMDPMFK
ncbi:MAG: DUF3048 domain-containing protein [Oscillospiraceae bacterium]|jgi:hypothetical protein|nr:DUF3048 domain-containing protein [Oscillospiraceae bacterium]